MYLRRLHPIFQRITALLETDDAEDGRTGDMEVYNLIIWAPLFVYLDAKHKLSQLAAKENFELCVLEVFEFILQYTDKCCSMIACVFFGVYLINFNYDYVCFKHVARAGRMFLVDIDLACA